jgi:hypothetical protein
VQLQVRPDVLSVAGGGRSLQDALTWQAWLMQASTSAEGKSTDHQLVECRTLMTPAVEFQPMLSLAHCLHACHRQAVCCVAPCLQPLSCTSSASLESSWQSVVPATPAVFTKCYLHYLRSDGK